MRSPRTWLAVTVALGLVLRVYHLGNDSLWFDETFSERIARLSALTIPRELGLHDTHPPLHYELLHVWTGLFGNSEVALRSLSVVVGVALIPVMFALGAAFAGQRAGLIAALFMALSPHHVRFSQEARMYILAALLTALSFLFLSRLLERRTHLSLGLYVVTTVLLLYTHAWGLLVLLAQAIALAIEVWQAPRRGRKRSSELLFLGGALAAVAVLYIPWAVEFARQGTRELARGSSAGLAWLQPPSLTDMSDTLRLWLGPPGAIAAGLLGVGWVAAARRAPKPKPTLRDRAFATLRDRHWLLLVLWVIVPLVTAVAVSFALHPIYLPRYTIPVSTGFYLVLAIAVARIGSRRVRVASTVALAIAFLTATVVYHARFEKEDWRGLVEHVNRQAAPGDLVLFGAGYVGTPFDYYSKRDDVLRRPFDEGVMVDGRRAPRVWLVQNPDSPAAQLATLTESYALKFSGAYHGDLRLTLLVQSDGKAEAQP